MLKAHLSPDLMQSDWNKFLSMFNEQLLHEVDIEVEESATGNVQLLSEGQLVDYAQEAARPNEPHAHGSASKIREDLQQRYTQLDWEKEREERAYQQQFHKVNEVTFDSTLHHELTSDLQTTLREEIQTAICSAER